MWVHFYDNALLDWKLETGTKLRLLVRTGMPWAGDVEVIIEPQKQEEFTLFLRIPGWSLTTRAEVNGDPAGAAQPGEYLALRRAWKPGDRVRLVFDMTPRRVFANPRVSEDYGKAALQRGPFIYCLERRDNPDVDVFEVSLDGRAPIETAAGTGTLGGAVLLRTQGFAYDGPLGRKPLYGYRPITAQGRVPLVFIPYYAFHDRGPADFTVWLPCRGCGF